VPPEPRRAERRRVASDICVLQVPKLIMGFEIIVLLIRTEFNLLIDHY
jgi:hypothetical protein